MNNLRKYLSIKLCDEQTENKNDKGRVVIAFCLHSRRYIFEDGWQPL